MLAGKALTPDGLRTMKIGSAFMSPGPLAGLSREPMTWRLVEITGGRSQFLFEVRYFGVKTMEVSASLRKGGVVLEVL
jgi:hypothetical protein